MANIKRCSRCGRMAAIIRKKDGFRWVHTCKKLDKAKLEGEPKLKFGDAVRDWNYCVKSMAEPEGMVGGGSAWNEKKQ